MTSGDDPNCRWNLRLLITHPSKSCVGDIRRMRVNLFAELTIPFVPSVNCGSTTLCFLQKRADRSNHRPRRRHSTLNRECCLRCMFIFDLTLVDRSRQARGGGDNSVALRRRFDRSKREVCVENVNLCAFKIGLLSNELFKCRTKKTRTKFLEQKHSEKEKTQRIRLGRKRNDDDAQRNTTDSLGTDQTLARCVCVQRSAYVCGR